ncbi:MAG: UDP-glucose 4-epimerase [Thermodesulfobacteriota bacterium]
MILVVGGAGYIGTHMVKELLSHGREVVVLDNLSTGHQGLIPGGIFVQGDLGDETLLRSLFTTYPIGTVMHFAAFSLVAESVAFPLKYYENNVAKTITLFKVMLEHGIKRFIFSSSAAVYGEPGYVPIDEKHPTVPTNPYGKTKLAIENMLEDCDKAYGLKYVSLRYFNAAGADGKGRIGECHNPETHLIPRILHVVKSVSFPPETPLPWREGMKGRGSEYPLVEIYGTDYDTPDGTCIRDYIHVNDLAQAHLLAMNALENGESSRIYNLGNNRGYSVKEVIEIAGQVTGRSIPVVKGPRRAGDPAILIASSEKISKELGWKPRYPDLKTMVKTAWKWHRNRT